MIRRLIKLGISITFWMADSFQELIIKALGTTHPGTCIILYYHVVTREQLPKFAQQMDELLRVAQPISLEGLANLEGGKHYAAVTFDDGFQESIENVLPELLKRNIPLTIFIPTGCLGLDSPWLKDKRSRDNGGLVLTADEIRKLGRNSMISFGSHCVTHRPLSSLPDQEAKQEIFHSKIKLEDILGREVQTLSFPHGAYDERHINWAKKAGYTRVLTIVPWQAISNKDEYAPGRIRVDPTDWRIEFCLKLAGSFRWLSYLATLKLFLGRN